MKSMHCFAALLALALAAITSSVANAQDRGSQESIAGKARSAAAAKAGKSGKATVQPAGTALKSGATQPVSKPATSEGALGQGKDGSKSHCHSTGSDA